MEEMMIELFVKIFNMSISAGILILIVMVWRLALSKAPKWIICLLWGLVAIKLICPFSFSSPFSVYRFINSAVTKNGVIEYVSYSNTPEKSRLLIGRPSEAEKIVDAQTEWSNAAEDYADTQNGAVQNGIAQNAEVQSTTAQNTTVQNIGMDRTLSDKEAVETKHITDIYLPPLITAWLLGIFGFFLYAFYSLISLKQRLREAVCDHDNIYLCDAVESPFILGIVSPKIYLPSDTKPEQMEYILAHEQAHLKRKDHWWKPLSYLLLAVYWFQPLCWAAYFLFCRDIEMACDERVIKDFDLQAKKEYSDTLLSFCLPKRTDIAYPLAFGEVSIKERVKSVLNYKKPAFWIFIAALAACAVTAVCFMTTPGMERAEKVNVAEAVEIEVTESDVMVTDQDRPNGGLDKSDKSGQKEEVPEPANAAQKDSDEEAAKTFEEVADRIWKAREITVYDWNTTADFKKDADLLIRMAADPTGEYEVYGIISREYGEFGFALNHTADGKDQVTDYIPEPWVYTGASASAPKLEWSEDGKNLYFSYIYLFVPKDEATPYSSDGNYLWRTCMIYPDYSDLLISQNKDKVSGKKNQYQDSRTADGRPSKAYVEYLQEQVSKDMGTKKLPFVVYSAVKENPDYLDVGVTEYTVDVIKKLRSYEIMGPAITIFISTESIEDLYEEEELQDAENLEEAIDQAIIQHHKNKLYGGNFVCESHVILGESGYPGYDDNALCKEIYAVVMCSMYNCTDTKTEVVSGVIGPCVLTFDVSKDGEYKLRDYWEPEDGGHYGPSIRDRFPADAVDDAIDAPKYADELSKGCDAKAAAYKPMKGN